MEKLTKNLLLEMHAAFPTFEWSDAELDDLVTPSFGLITGFPELLSNIDRLCKRDLGELSPAGVLPAPDSSHESPSITASPQSYGTCAERR